MPERDTIPTFPFLKIEAGIIPILHSSGVNTPGQLGPIKVVFAVFNFAFTFNISNTGIPSVIQITSSRPASIASRIESAANGGGTITIDTVAPVAATASFTVLNTGKPK